MPRVPFIGRLFIHEYLALIVSFVLILLETIVRTITLLLPGPIIRFCYRASRNAFNSLSSPHSRRNRNRKKSVSSPIAQASDFVELCNLYGYYAEEHIVQTGDGYLLGLHRLGWRKGEEDQRVNGGPGSVQKKVVYLHHGLMMNSEVWVCITEQERCLPFQLVEQGYDVWLGNNRGNKYSKKSVHHSPTEIPFWNFSMDQFAFHDIPDSINYVLSTTRQPSLSYIGFSQGTAQAFATLSIHPTLNEKVDVFIALAPAMAPPGLASGFVSSFVKTSPEVLFLAFGRRAILGSATMWQALLYPAIFTWFIDKSLSFLFGWRTQNITAHQKLAAYPHLYSFSSTKSVVHWFQIIRNGTFQMYDDEFVTPLSLTNGSKYYKVAKFPTRNIKTPILLVYGGSDSLVDIKLMLKELPRHTVAKGIEKYEHLDLLWASDVHTLVFPHVMEALEYHAGPEKTKREALSWRNQRAITSPYNGSQPPGYSDDENRRPTLTPNDTFDFGISTSTEQLDESESDSTPERLALTPQPGLRVMHQARSSISSSSRTVTSPKRATFSPRLRVTDNALAPSSPVASAFTDHTDRDRPEGWWSSDSTTENSPTITKTVQSQAGVSALPSSQGSKHKKSPSIDSTRSSDASFSDRGISLAGKAGNVGGVVTSANARAGGLLRETLDVASSEGDGSGGGKKRARRK